MPLGLAIARSVAPVAEIALAVLVETVGAFAEHASVKKVEIGPFVVPALLVARTRKSYAVPQISPVTALATGTGELPAPTDPNDALRSSVPPEMPKSKNAVVERLFGFTVPFKVAPVSLIGFAFPVTAPGAPAQAVVENASGEPVVVPPAFWARTRT